VPRDVILHSDKCTFWGMRLQHAGAGARSHRLEHRGGSPLEGLCSSRAERVRQRAWRAILRVPIGRPRAREGPAPRPAPGGKTGRPPSGANSRALVPFGTSRTSENSGPLETSLVHAVLLAHVSLWKLPGLEISGAANHLEVAAAQGFLC
jgi:hypothetical protein